MHENLYRLIAESSGDVVWTLDADTGRFTWVSPGSLNLLGIAPENIIGKNLEDVLHPDSRARVSELLGEKEPAFVKRVEGVRLLRADGTAVMAEMVVARQDPTNGRAREFLGVVRDITERTRREAQHVQTQKMEAVGQLAGGIAHDLNNLLQVIHGYSRLASDALPEDSDPRRQLSEVLGAAERARTLVLKLLAFSRREGVCRDPVDLGELVADQATMLRRVLGDQYTLTTAGDGAPTPVRVDSSGIEQVLVNLCLNSKEAMPGGGKIRINVSRVSLDGEFCRANPWARPGEFALLTVTDAGRGMPPEVMAHLFEPFFTTKPKGKSAGLGLAMVYGIVKQHEGFLGVRSSPRDGTSIDVHLPLAAVPVSATGGPRVGTRTWGGSETVLLAEDDESVRGFSRQVLSGAGYRVLSACDGAEAMSLFEQHHAELAVAIVNVTMPKLSGRVVADRIREVAPRLPVIFSTGYDYRLLEEGFMPSADRVVMRKPFSHEELLKKVRELIDATR